MSRKRKPLLKGDRDQLGKYVREMADLCGLRDWTIVMKHGNPDNATSGSDIEAVYGQKIAHIRFRDDWGFLAADELRWLVTHELMHIHLWPLSQRLCDLQGILGNAVYEVVNAAHREAIEHAGDGIARNWAETLPLPVKEKARR